MLFQQQLEEARRRATMDEARLKIDRERLGLERQRVAQAGAGAGAGGAPELPKLQAGQMWVDVPGAGLMAAPIRGTTAYAEVVKQDDALQQAQQRIGRLIDMVAGREETVNGRKVRVGGVGTELWGEDAATMSGLRAGIIADVAKLRDMGVLQSGELENLEKQLPDPGGVGSVLRRKSSIVKSYEELSRQFREKRASHLKANPWLTPAVPPPPPGFKVQ
jgi:hypothetical protein